MSWYYASGDQQLGPVSDEELNGLVQQGTVTEATLVWKEGMSDWVPYSTVGGAGEGAGGAGIVCVECGKQFPFEEVVRFGENYVCAACKPVFVQRMQEGSVASGPMEYAGFWIRFGARFVDNIILQIAGFGIGFAVGAAMAGGGTPEEMAQVQIVAGLLGGLFGLIYEVFFLGKFGATPGKMALKLKVVRPDGQPIGYGRALGRYFAQILSALILMIGYLMAAFDREQHRALHDRICDTRVIRS